MSEEEILDVFRSHGLDIDPCNTCSVRGQAAQLIAGADALIEACAEVAESQKTGTRYQWVAESLFGRLADEIAMSIRSLKP